MTRRGFRVDTTTRAMAIRRRDRRAASEIELGPPDPNEYLRIIEVPDELLAGVDASHFHNLAPG